MQTSPRSVHRLSAFWTCLLFVGLILIGVGAAWGGFVAIGLASRGYDDTTLGAIGLIASVIAALGMCTTGGSEQE